MKNEIIERLIDDYEKYVELEKIGFKRFRENKNEDLHDIYCYRWQKAEAIKNYLYNLLEYISKGE